MADLTVQHVQAMFTVTKMIKRQMYGHASFTLLRYRILLG